MIVQPDTMKTGLRQKWRAFRSRKALSLAFDVALLVAAMLAVHAWQTRALPVDEPAPVAALTPLDGSQPRLTVETGRVGVVYFFAPWCNICRKSIGGLDELVADGSVSWASAVALDYADQAAVEVFVNETAISLPVLMGTRQDAEAWNIRAFPTYFVIDAHGRIASRSVGYSTKLGIRARAWLAR